MPAPNVIKHSQRESQLFQEIAQLLRQAAVDDPRLGQAFINRVQLSPDGSICTVYFYTPGGQEHFKTVLETLKLYKNSLRKALAERLNRRYTPELVFKFDTRFEKQQKLEALLDKIKADLPS
jgi:ribosome-binding factor A